MKTFCVQTLGCKVNQYEGEQLATMLRARGWTQADPAAARLRIINSCSVTVQAASQSRQAARRAIRLPVLGSGPVQPAPRVDAAGHPPSDPMSADGRARVLITGCWATSDREAASALAGVDAVLTHHDDMAAELDRLLTLWQLSETAGAAPDAADPHACASGGPPGSMNTDGWMKAGTAAGERTLDNKSNLAVKVNELSGSLCDPGRDLAVGAITLPPPDPIQPGRQRAFLKVQDGCDAHCTYCIIPRLRPRVWSKPVDDAVEEARRLVAAGHIEIVLTGIFLGAYGHPTALRRRQPQGGPGPIVRLLEALCTRVPGLRRVRFSSLEPGDLSDDLLAAMAAHPQVVPHLHLPLQSGSDLMLRRMNRQYGADDFRRMLDRARDRLDRPALTTDVIVGFPGEGDGEFADTVDLVRAGGFIHVHAFPFSPRPGTAAARWTRQFVCGHIVNQRMGELRHLAEAQSVAFRSQFVGRVVEVIVEQDAPGDRGLRHGRGERYFPVHFASSDLGAGQAIQVRVERVTPTHTFGACA